MPQTTRFRAPRRAPEPGCRKSRAVVLSSGVPPCETDVRTLPCVPRSTPAAARRRALLAAALSALTFAAACGKRTVPFKRDGTTAAPSATPDAGPTAAAPVPQGQTYPPRTQRIELGPRKLEIGEGAIRASLELAGPKPDAPTTLLLVLERPDGALTLERRLSADDETWADSERIALLLDPTLESDRCAVDAARLSALSPTSAAVVADLQCTSSGAPAATPPQPAAPASGEQRIWAAALAPAPRVIATVAVLPASDPTLGLVAALEQLDLDGDNRLDLLVRIVAALGDDSPPPIELKLFDRAGGMTREGVEPENTLHKLAERAVEAHTKREPRAESLARSVLLLHRALCKEPGSPRLLISGRGLDCGASLAAGRAASVLTAELARQGKLLDALEASRGMQQPFYRLAEADLARAQQALRARADNAGLAWREGISVDVARAPAVRHSALGFIDDGHVLIRGPTARSYDIAANRADPVGINAGLDLVDPTGRHTVASIKRSCEGYHLAIVRSSQVVAGIVTGPSVAEPLFAHAPPPAGARCPDLSAEQRRDQGGYRVVEWTAAGIVLARAQNLLLLAVDSGANASEPAKALAAGDPLPSVTYSGEFTPDGRSHVWLSPEGIALRDRSRDAVRFLSPPAGTGSMTDVAISPSGRTLAVLRGGRLFVGALDAPAPPPSH